MTYNENEIRARFLLEYARVKAARNLTDAEFCESIDRPTNYISRLAAPDTKYLINTKDLFYAAAQYGFDLKFILLGKVNRNADKPPPLRELAKSGMWKREKK